MPAVHIQQKLRQVPSLPPGGFINHRLGNALYRLTGGTGRREQAHHSNALYKKPKLVKSPEISIIKDNKIKLKIDSQYMNKQLRVDLVGPRVLSEETGTQTPSCFLSDESMAISRSMPPFLRFHIGGQADKATDRVVIIWGCCR